MKYITHTIGKFGSGHIDTQSKNLMIICNDTDCINRVYKSENATKLTPFGRGWSLNIPKSKQGDMVFEDGKLTKFIDVRGTCYGFFYYSGFLRNISTPRGMISYDYNADGMLTRVVYPDGSGAHICYRDVYYMHDICVCDSEGNGKVAVSYADSHYSNGVGCVYEYFYDKNERIEKRFTEVLEGSHMLTLTNQNDIILSK